VLGKNFGLPASLFDQTPEESQRYIFLAPLPGSLGGDAIAGATPAPRSFSYRLRAQDPIKTAGGTVQVNDSTVFPVNTAIATALVEVNPGAMRELHWHPNGDEWLYVIEGQARMGVFAGQGQARTFDLRAGDVGYVPVAMGHYLENTGSVPFRFLETFKSPYFVDFSLDT
jgi:oxalate decarboxylase